VGTGEESGVDYYYGHFIIIKVSLHNAQIDGNVGRIDDADILYVTSGRRTILQRNLTVK
jgi:hypothetical protein